MKLNKIINFVIITLVVTAVYQTGTLWLEGTTSHNFFYTVFTALGNDNLKLSQESKIVEPSRMVIGYGNKKFSVVYPQEKYDSIMNKTNSAVKQTIVKGQAFQTEALDWNEILTSKCILLEYEFMISMNEYLKAFQIKSHSAVTQINQFDTIAIIPARNSGEMIKIYFIDSKEQKSYCYALSMEKYTDGLYNDIEQFQLENEKGLIYISTKQREFNIFKENTFVPQWTQSRLEYFSVKQESPFEENGMIYVTPLENAIDHLFKNLASKWSRKDENGVFCFSDETTVVKYYPQGVLEYFNYESYNTNVVQTLSSAYAACISFMKNDSTLNTNIYLSDVQIKSDEIIFYFDYHVNNYPIIISHGEKVRTGISHAIEVTVKADSVKKYKRYAYNFVLDESSKKYVEEDFLTALNEAILKQQYSGDAVTEVDNITLGYYVTGEKELDLQWFTQIGQTIYLGDTIKEE